MSKILIGLPTYNEESVISDVIDDIKNEGFEDILVVDDCSTDNTYNILKNLNILTIRHKKNKGAGAATRTIINYAKKNKYDYLVLIDSDGQHNPKEIKKLLKYSDKYNVVIGSRIINNGIKNLPFQRKIANFVGSLITYIFFGKFVWDSQSGFKVLDKKAINKMNITFDRFEFCSEMIGEIKKHKLTVIEVPISVKYSKDTLNKSHGQNILNGFKMVIRFIKFKFKIK
jgi:dolichol-phosphate mannosyltransferase